MPVAKAQEKLAAFIRKIEKGEIDVPALLVERKRERSDDNSGDDEEAPRTQVITQAQYKVGDSVEVKRSSGEGAEVCQMGPQGFYQGRPKNAGQVGLHGPFCIC